MKCRFSQGQSGQIHINKIFFFDEYWRAFEFILQINKKSYLQEEFIQISFLFQDIIVDHLQRRFSQGQIYTYIGDILIAVNPYAEMGIYTDAEAKLYRSRGKMDHPPHIFAVADTAYHTMLHLKMNQSIIVSGESGSGKTESANFLLRQLVYLGKVR